MKTRLLFIFFWAIGVIYYGYSQNKTEEPEEPDEPEVQNGTEEFPFLISSFDELNTIRFHKDTSYYYQLDADINMADRPYWDPIGTEDIPFKGHLDGNGYSIYNMSFPDQKDTIGLFGYIDSASVQNLFIDSLSAKGGNCVGAIAAYVKNSRISSSYAHVTLFGKENTGGIAGVLIDSEIDNCFTSGTIKGTSNVGGIIGAGLNEASISYCYSLAQILASSNNSGGLAGKLQAQGKYPIIKNSFAANQSIDCSGMNIGRIVGSVNQAQISCCYGLYSTLVNGKKIREGDTHQGVTIEEHRLQREAFFMDPVNWENGVESWDMRQTWSVADHFSYPFFQSQISPVIVTHANQSLLSGQIKMEESEDDLLYISVCTLNGDLLQNLYPDESGRWAWEHSFVPGECLVIRASRKYYPSSYPLSLRISDFEQGIGTQSSPFIIQTTGDLDQLKKEPYIQGDYHFKLQNDLDLSGISSFTPIGSALKPFSGYFYGGGHLIKQLQIDQGSKDYQGLFGKMIYAFVDSLGLVNSRIKGNNKIGVLTGEAFRSHIQGVFSTGCVAARNNIAGGLIGSVTDSTCVESCFSSCMVTGKDSVGGFIGIANQAKSIQNCFSMAVVSGDAVVGGFVGMVNRPLSNCYSGSFVRGGIQTGIFAGYNYADHINCYANSTTGGELECLGFDFNQTQTVKLLSTESLSDAELSVDWGDAWIKKTQSFPELKLFCESTSEAFKSASALHASPIYFSQGETASKVSQAFTVPLSSNLDKSIHYRGEKCRLQQDTVISIQIHQIPDTLYLCDSDFECIRPFVFVPYHIAPVPKVSVSSNESEYTGEWSNQTVSFSLRTEKELISGPAIFKDSIYHLNSKESRGWEVCPGSFELNKDTLLEIAFFPESQVGKRGNMSALYTIRIDKTKPSLRLLPNPSFMSSIEEAVDSVVVKVEFPDNLSGIDLVSWESVGLEPKVSGNLFRSGDSLVFQNIGSYGLQVKAVDKAGNDTAAYLDLFVREKRQLSSLKDLVVNGESMQLEDQVFDYYLSDSVLYSTPSIAVYAMPTDKNALLTSNASYDLVPRDNQLSLLVQAEDRRFASMYTIHVYRKNNNTQFSALNIGEQRVAISPEVSEYSIAVSSSMSTVRTSYILSDQRASCAIQPVYSIGDEGSTTSIHFSVTAESPEYVQDYVVDVYRKKNITSLQSLHVHGKAIDLNGGASDFHISVPSTVSQVDLQYELTDCLGMCTALPAYILSEPGTNTVIDFLVYAEDREVKQSYRVSVHRQSDKAELQGIVLNGQSYPNGMVEAIPIDCHLHQGEINAIAAENGTVSYLQDGQEYTSNPFVLAFPYSGKYELTVKITPEDASQPSKNYTLNFIKWFGTDVLFSRWEDVIAVRKEHNAYSFDRVEWYREGHPEELSGDPAAGFLKLRSEGEYYAVLSGKGPQGYFSGVRTCSLPFSLQRINISVHPNPIGAGQTISVTSEMPAEEFTNAVIMLVHPGGSILLQQALVKRETQVIMPSTPGTYLLKIITGSGATREFKLIVY